MRLLIVGNMDVQVTEATRIAQAQGADVNCVPTPEDALSLLLSGEGADLLLVDVALDIAKLISSLKQEHIFVSVVAYGLHSNSKDAVNAIKSGAQEYLPLPPEEELIAAILQAITEENTEVIYASDAMKKVIELADKVAPSDAGVLITGESGTGKEIISRYIHQKSPRAKAKFISVNCAAIPDNLLESELFGHEKGAFTGATNRRIGKFEEANNGTLLLDEISEMDIRLQAKLLRAIQEKEIDRVGGSQPVKLNLRIIATSNRNLMQEVEKGTFREDLLFRLNVIQLSLPPLRERKEDILLFAEHFAHKYATSNNVGPFTLSEDAIKKLQHHAWPGNVRELENTMHRAVLLASGNSITEDAIMFNTSSASTADSTPSESAGVGMIGRTVDSVEKELILGTLDHCLGNRTHAANILGISIRTLRNKLNQYNDENSENDSNESAA